MKAEKEWENNYKVKNNQLGMAVYTWNPNAQEADVGGLSQIQDPLDLYSEFQVSQDHITRLFQ